MRDHVRLLTVVTLNAENSAVVLLDWRECSRTKMGSKSSALENTDWRPWRKRGVAIRGS